MGFNDWTPGVPQFKQRGPSQKVLRRKKLKALRGKEDAEKAIVRRRDKRCRFPLCKCGTYKLNYEVSHGFHKGMGGSPSGGVNIACLMVYLCRARHRASAFAVDVGTLRWRSLTPDQADDAIAWDIRVEDLLRCMPKVNLVASFGEWFELAREASPGRWEPFTPIQREILERLEGYL